MDSHKLLLGANLADIESRSENNFISNFITSDTWTAGLLEIESDTWHWEGGSAWSWSGWTGAGKGKPRYGCLKILTGGNIEIFLPFTVSDNVSPGGNWSSADCSSELSVLCELKWSDLVTDMVSGRSGVIQGHQTHF